MLNRLGMVHLAMDPHYPSNFEAILGISHQLLKRYDEAVNHYNTSLKRAPKFPIPLVHLEHFQFTLVHTQRQQNNFCNRAQKTYPAPLRLPATVHQWSVPPPF